MPIFAMNCVGFNFFFYFFLGGNLRSVGSILGLFVLM